MTSRTHRIQSYNYSFDARAGGPGRLQLWGNHRNIAEVQFVDDVAPVPAPILASDLSSATLFFRRGAMLDLVTMLRNTGSLGLTIDDQGYVVIRNTFGLADSIVVCTSCAPDLLAAKTRGIQEAMRRLVAFIGADARPEVCPVTFHLDDDSYCAPYQSGQTTGSFSTDAEGLGHVCLYAVEHSNDGSHIPFTVESAAAIQNQLLAIHETMHAWFVGRQQHYRIQEPFCKLISFIISEMDGGPDYCSWFAATPDEHPDALMKYLCGMGMNAQQAAQILKQLADAADERGHPLSEAQFAQIVSDVLGQDAVPAFRAAGLLP